MAGHYKSTDVQKLFGISHETVRRWAEEFQQYLSPDATPGTGKHRVFNDDDLEVMALIADMRRKNRSPEDIAAALATGQRGDIPDSLEARELDLRASLQVQIAQREIETLQLQLNEAQQDAQQWRDKAQRLQGQLDAMQSQIAAGRGDELTTARKQIEELNREIGKLQAMLELLKGKGD